MKMKNKIFKAVISAVLALAVILPCGCDLTRKLNGAEVNFKNKVENAEEISFDLFITVKDESGTSSLDISCYMKGEDYAYVFPNPSGNTEYRKLYADGKLYEFMTSKNLPTGSYYEEEADVSADDNILYWVRKNIMLATYATLITEGKKENDGDKTVYRYDFTYGGNDYSLWYDEENMVKISATFYSTDNSGEVHSETYTAQFSNYLFENVSAEPFKRPQELKGLYVESSISFESWMTIIGKFGTRATGWL